MMPLIIVFAFIMLSLRHDAIAFTTLRYAADDAAIRRYAP